MLSPALFLSLLTAAVFLYSHVLMRLALRPWERAHDQHWTERARWLWQVRKSRAAIAISIIILAALSAHEFTEAGGPDLPVVLCALAGFSAAQFFIDRRIWPGLSPRLWLVQTCIMFGFAFALVGTIVWVILCTSEHLTRTDWLRLGVAALILLLFYSGVWLLALPGRGKNPLTPRLRRIVDEVVAKSGVRPVRAWVADAVNANALALMYIRSIVVTAPAMRILSDDELRTIVQHEMAHLGESWPVLAARLVGGLSLLGFAFISPVVHHVGIFGVFWILLAVILLKRFSANIAKRMENRADSMSVTQEEDGPLYARALEKLYEASQLPAVMTKRLVHPHLYDRMLAAGLTPDYPRPAPPPSRHWTFYASLVPASLWLGIKLAIIF